MTFEQLMKEAAKNANENELVELTINQIQKYFSSKANNLQDVDDALDWAFDSIFSEKRKSAWILIKVTE